MQFGKVTNLEGIDLSLPKDFDANTIGKPSDRLKIFVGGTVWMPKSWKNVLYPKGTKPEEAPTFYSTHFNTIELNATHYKIYPPEHLYKWRVQVPDSFRFCPKIPQLISHYRRLKNCDAPLDDFFRGIQAFDTTLGPCFLQMPPNFTPNHFDTLEIFLRKWPTDVPLAIELRHERWFSDTGILSQTIDLLRELCIGFVITDTAGRRDVIHMALTAPFLLVRFGGNEGVPSDETRLNAWIERIENWKNKGLQELYLLVHQPDSEHTPETCRLFWDLLDKRKKSSN